MARLATQSQTAASGMDSTSDPVSMSIARARRLVNFQLSRSGRVGTNLRLVNALPVEALGPIDGVAWYYQAALRNNPFTTDIFFSDLLLWAARSFLFGGRASTDPLNTPVTAVAFIPDGLTGYTPFGPFFEGKRVRFFSLSDEILMVQDGGLLMLRAYFSPTLGQGFFRAGFEPPTTSNLTLSATGTGLTGTYGYKLTYADERFRESSPTPVVEITLTNEGTHVVSSDIGFYAPPASYGGSNYRYAYLYRNTLGSPDVFYQIARHTIAASNPGSITFTTGDFYAGNNYDNAPDATITGGTLAPNPGENDPPLPASIGVIHKNRVFLNDINDPNTLQVSNQGSPVQFAALSTLPTDGGRFEIGTDQGNAITALVEFGSVLAIFKRRGSFFLYGDNLSDFVVRPVHQRGCIAPDSAYRCDNVVCFLSDDGVYAAAYEGGDVVTKISKEIETDLLAQPITDRETSVGWFVDNRYHLAVGTIIYVYDFDAQGWTCYTFGSGPLSYGGGIPDASVIAGMGFGSLGNSSIFGSIVPAPQDCGDGGGGDGGGCSVTVDPPAASIDGIGGPFEVTVTAANLATIPYATSVPWLHVSGQQSGSGIATIIVDPNPTCFQRIGIVTICSASVTVTQDRSGDCACMIESLTPDTFDVDWTAQTVTTAYVEDGTIAITEQALVPWLHPHTPVPPTGTGTIDIDIDANNSCQDRTGQVQICDKFVTVNQAADPDCGCSVTITPNALHTFPGEAGSFGFTVVNLNDSHYACTTDVPWITITLCPGDSGAGIFHCTFDYETLGTDEVGHIFLCNAVFTVISDQHS